LIANPNASIVSTMSSAACPSSSREFREEIVEEKEKDKNDSIRMHVTSSVLANCRTSISSTKPKNIKLLMKCTKRFKRINCLEPN
jgi:hypothetical protein